MRTIIQAILSTLAIAVFQVEVWIIKSTTLILGPILPGLYTKVSDRLIHHEYRGTTNDIMGMVSGILVMTFITEIVFGPHLLIKVIVSAKKQKGSVDGANRKESKESFKYCCHHNFHNSHSKAYIPPEHKIPGIRGWCWAMYPTPEFCVTQRKIYKHVGIFCVS